MVKVLDPDGVIIGVYESPASVPEHIPNRFHTYSYPREECVVVEVPEGGEDYRRLLPSLRRAAH